MFALVSVQNCALWNLITNVLYKDRNITGHSNFVRDAKNFMSISGVAVLRENHVGVARCRRLGIAGLKRLFKWIGVDPIYVLKWIKRRLNLHSVKSGFIFWGYTLTSRYDFTQRLMFGKRPGRRPPLISLGTPILPLITGCVGGQLGNGGGPLISSPDDTVLVQAHLHYCLENFYLHPTPSRLRHRPPTSFLNLKHWLYCCSQCTRVSFGEK